MRQLPAYLLTAAIGGIPLAAPAAAAPDRTQGVAIMSANVADNGNLASLKSSGALSAARISTGIYDVLFVRNIAECIPLTTGFSGAFAGLAGTVGDNTGFRVQTRFRGSNSLADIGFNIVVFCPR